MRAHAFGVLAALGVLACATEGPPSPATIVPIDIEPRCEPAIGGFESLGADALRFDPSSRVLEQVDLPRGVRWTATRLPHAPLETLHWGFPARSSHAESDLELAAALLQAGAGAADEVAFRGRALALGASMQARADTGWLWLELRYPTDARADAVALLGDWIRPRVASPASFSRIRRSVSLARLARTSNPGTQAARLFEKLHPVPGRPPRPREPAEPATPESIQALLLDLLQPEGSALLMVSPDGAPARSAVRARVEEWIQRGPERGRKALAVDAPAGAEATDAGGLYVVDRPASPQVELLVGFPTPGADARDFPALETLASLLGHPVGGRLFRDLRERQGLAYIIGAEQSHAARFVVSTRARPERAVALVRGIEAHLQALASQHLLRCEIDMLEARMEGESQLRWDDPDALLTSLRRDIIWRGEITPRFEAHRAVARGSRADADAPGGESLDAVARRHLSGSPTVVLVGDAKTLGRELARAYPGRKVRVFDAELERIR